MNWEPIVKKLAKHGLNLLGSAIPGGSFISGVVCDILDCDDNPSAINQALAKANPETIAKLKELELNHKAELQKIVLGNETARIQAINETMRVEAKSEKFIVYAWRPLIGLGLGIVCLCVAAMVLFAVFTNNIPLLNEIPKAIESMSYVFLSMGATTGVTAYTRGQEKIKRLSNNL